MSSRTPGALVGVVVGSAITAILVVALARRDVSGGTEKASPGSSATDTETGTQPLAPPSCRRLLERRNRVIHERVDACEARGNPTLDCMWWVFGGDPPLKGEPL